MSAATDGQHGTDGNKPVVPFGSKETVTDGPPYQLGSQGQLARFSRHEVFEIKVQEGCVVDAEPFRYVTYWVLLDGRLLARFDPKDTA